MIPRQHGAWSILISCFIIGAWLGGRFGAVNVFLLISAILAFLARHAVVVYLRPSKAAQRNKKVLALIFAYSSIILLMGAFLVLGYGLWLLLPLGFVALTFGGLTLILMARGKEFTTGGEIVGILGLTLIAPAAEYSATGVFSIKTVGLWIVCAFFFVGSVFHVRYLVRRKKESMGPPAVRLGAGGPSIVYHLAVIIVAIMLGPALHVLPYLAPVALLPVTLKALWAVGRRYERPLAVRQIGYREVVHTLVFIILVGLAFALEESIVCLTCLR